MIFIIIIHIMTRRHILINERVQIEISKLSIRLRDLFSQLVKLYSYNTLDPVWFISLALHPSSGEYRIPMHVHSSSVIT